MLQMFSKKKGEKGFTLIELLVVIAIIGILATIVLVSLNTARQKARDARRQSDMHQVSLAMEMCYDDAGCGAGASAYVSQAAVPTAIGTYMVTLPLDPQGGSYTWLTNAGDNQKYFICADLEGGGRVESSRHGTKTDSAASACSTVATLP